MPRTVFFSWQSDLRTNKALIQEALESALALLGAEWGPHLEASVDRDTFQVPGAPNIAEVIYAKIDRAAAFVCDVSMVTMVGERRPSPNPNVLLELGYAMRALGDKRLVLAINEHVGGKENLPFDLRSKRILPFLADPKAGGQQRAATKRELSNDLVLALCQIFEDAATGNVARKLVNTLNYVLVYGDESSERTEDPARRDLIHQFQFYASAIRHLAASDDAVARNMLQPLEELADHLDAVVRFDGYLGDADEFIALIAEAAEAARAIRGQWAPHVEREIAFQHAMAQRLRNEKMRLEALGRRVARALATDDSDASPNLIGEASAIGDRLCETAQYDLDSLVPGLAARLREPARRLHLLRYQALQVHSWDGRRNLLMRFEEVRRALDVEVDFLAQPRPS
jgi:hypothetical protein